MDTDAKGQVGGIDSTEAARKKMAGESGAYRCAACGGRSNAEIMREREELAREAEGEGKQEEEEEAVPEELRLAYREDLAKEDGEGEKAQASSSSGGAAAAAAEKTGGGDDVDAPTSSSAATPPRTEPAAEAPPTRAPTTTTTTAAAPGAPAVPAPTRTVPAAAPALRQQQRPLDDGVPAWIDKAIYGVLGALAFMILRKFF